jgi:Mg2+ and Co2+ transporter CorA
MAKGSKRSSDRFIREKFKERRDTYAKALEALKIGASKIEASETLDVKTVAGLLIAGLRSIYSNLKYDSDLIEAAVKEDRVTRDYVDDVRKAVAEDLEWLANRVETIEGANTRIEEMQRRLDKLGRKLARRTARTPNLLVEITKKKAETDTKRLLKGLLYIV